MRHSGLPICQYDTLVIICPSCVELDTWQPSCSVIARGIIIIARAHALSKAALNALPGYFFTDAARISL
jgi:hypothetical protein